MWLCQRPANSKGRLVTSIKEFLNAIVVPPPLFAPLLSTTQRRQAHQRKAHWSSSVSIILKEKIPIQYSSSIYVSVPSTIYIYNIFVCRTLFLYLFLDNLFYQKLQWPP